MRFTSWLFAILGLLCLILAITLPATFYSYARRSAESAVTSVEIGAPLTSNVPTEAVNTQSSSEFYLLHSKRMIGYLNTLAMCFGLVAGISMLIIAFILERVLNRRLQMMRHDSENQDAIPTK